MYTFPSLEWFQELVRLMEENEDTYRRLGYADVTWALDVQTSSPTQVPQLFRFVFEEYTCIEVTELEPGSDPDADFTLQATLDTWCDMIRNIQDHNGPDLDHSLNKLALMDDPIYVAAADFLSRDLFARYGQTFQQFFNGAIDIPTDFGA
jgi:hypothetical protein